MLEIHPFDHWTMVIVIGGKVAVHRFVPCFYTWIESDFLNPTQSFLGSKNDREANETTQSETGMSFVKELLLWRNTKEVDTTSIMHPKIHAMIWAFASKHKTVLVEPDFCLLLQRFPWCSWGASIYCLFFHWRINRHSTLLAWAPVFSTTFPGGAGHKSSIWQMFRSF